MSEFFRIITHARRLKSNLKDLSVEQLEELKNKLTKIIEDRVLEEEKVLQENAEKLEKIRKIREMIAAEGIDVEDLQSSFVERTGKRAPRKPKYEVYNEAGQRITWTGQGRMPNILKNRIEGGDTLETFLIDP